MKRGCSRRMSNFALDTMNRGCVTAEYAVRGPIVTRSHEIEAALEKDPHSFPFKQIIPCNIGNPQALLQKPITFYRQVTSLVNCPWMLDEPSVLKTFPKDVVKRAQTMLDGIGHYHKTGAYTNSQGYAWVRQTVASSLSERDGVPADPKDIYLTDGASPGIRVLLQMLIAGPKDALMIPIPQYPLYTATIATFGGQAVGYYLDEANHWSMKVPELEMAYQKAKDNGLNLRALVVINPGNPTGQVMTENEIKEVCAWAEEKGLLVLADEVYQENIYGDDLEFVSFKKVVASHFPNLPLVSFHSISKGFIGECGKRGGYMEVHNLPTDVCECIYKMMCISLCANVTGQILVDLMMNPPTNGDESYEVWAKEYFGLRASLAKRAKIVVDGLNSIPGIRTNKVAGAMYAFPSLLLPAKFIEEAKAAGKEPDQLWCEMLLEDTGILVVPGSGFGQREGTYHFRITILPPEEMIGDMILRTGLFQEHLVNKYGPIPEEN